MAIEPRHEKNASGPFYVVKGHCISCGGPRAEAPGLVTLGEDGCYFHKQPETVAEVNDAIRAMYFSCIEAYRYGGDDLTVRRRLAESGCAHLCDDPLEQHPVILRSHVRFTHASSSGALDIATLLLSWFEQSWKNGRCTKAVTGDAITATFDHTHSDTYGTALSYRLSRIENPFVAPAMAYRSPADLQFWLLVEEGGSYPPIGLHQLLEKNGAANIRWFSHDEWAASAAGQELPY